MDSEIKNIISFIFNRSGKNQMNYSEIYLNLSIDLNWFTPDKAKKFLNYAIKNKYLKKKGHLIEPNFDLNNITIPVGFYPSKKLQFDENNDNLMHHKDLLKDIINIISKKTNLTYDNIKEKIRLISKEKNLNDEVSALLFAKEFENNFNEYYTEIENKILTKS